MSDFWCIIVVINDVTIDHTFDILLHLYHINIRETFNAVRVEQKK